MPLNLCLNCGVHTPKGGSLICEVCCDKHHVNPRGVSFRAKVSWPVKVVRWLKHYFRPNEH